MHINLNSDVAEARVRARNQQGHRFTPLEYVSERNTQITALLPEYKSVIDQFIEVDNSDDPFTGEALLYQQLDQLL